ncbi:MAG TPA: hypothetical protein V6D27_00865 [Vampirovibrionales bacterium]
MDLIIYHESKPGDPCPDGLAAAAIARLKYPDAAVMGACHQFPIHLPFWITTSARILLVDFAIPLEEMRRWVVTFREVMVIDHHQTAWDDLRRIEAHFKLKAHFDMGESGATLTWRTLFPGVPVPPVLQHIRDRDLWKFQRPKTPIYHEAMTTLRDGLMVENQLVLYQKWIGMDQQTLDNALREVGEQALKEKMERVRKIAHRWFPITPAEWWDASKARHPIKDTYEGRVTYRSSDWASPSMEAYNEEIVAIYGCNFWELKPEIAAIELLPEEFDLRSDVAAFIYNNLARDCLFVAIKTSPGHYSLRSRSGFGIAALARAYGGGGHKASAGFVLGKLRKDIF